MGIEGTAARCENVLRTYWSETGPVEALRDVTARFPTSAITAVMGPSGSGKSSLLRVIAAIDRPDAGSVKIAEVELTGLSPRRMRRARRRLVGYVFQRPADNFVSYLTVSEHLQMKARRNSGSPLNAGELLARFGLANRARHFPHELSGGEQQRAALAHALMANPAILIADEPTAELDARSSKDLLDVLLWLAGRGSAVIVATHDQGVVDIADQVLELRRGQMVSRETQHVESEGSDRPGP